MDLRKEQLPQLIGVFILGVFFFILSSLNIFENILDKSQKIQSGYRANINQRLNSINDNLKVFTDLSSLKSERDDYREKLIQSKSELGQLKDQLAEEDLMKKQNSSYFHADFKLVPGQIIRYDKYSSGDFVINRGSDDSIKNGDIVIYLNYAIGEVIEVSKSNSTVRSIFSNKSKIAVRDENGIKGVLVFDNKNGLIVEKISNENQIELQKNFFTYGVNSNYPEGLLVGNSDKKLSAIVDTSQSVSIENPISLESLNEIFVINK